MDRVFEKLFTPNRVILITGGYLVFQLASFLYGDCIPGIFNRSGGVRGHDLLQFYISGRIVADQQSKKLYDQDFFLQKQYEIIPYDEAYRSKRTRYYSLYPPTMALAFSPLAKSVSYETFFKFGRVWILSGFGLAVYWLMQDLNPSSKWRWAALLGILSFHPTQIMYVTGQFGWLWMLSLMGCFRFRRCGQSFAAGICLSLLALKPQFAVVAVLWLLMRRSWRTLFGMFAGFAVQGIVVILFLGPRIWIDYVNGAVLFTQMHRLFQFNAEYQQSVLGTVNDLLGGNQIQFARCIHLVIVALTLYLSHRVFRFQGHQYRIEESTVILIVVLIMPHLLIYDLVLLLIPISHLFALHRDEPNQYSATLPALLYLMPMIALVYPVIPGISLVPLFTLFTLYDLAIHAKERTQPSAITSL